jgi:plasmid stabilization system protein ParE
MRVGYSEDAAARLEEIIEHFFSVNPFAASRFLVNLERAHARVCKFPRSGSRLRQFSHQEFREFIVRPYRFFYYVEERRKMIWIVDVWHSAQVPAQPREPAIGADI